MAALKPTPPKVTQHGGHAVALSTNVADVFGKKHPDVTRLIDRKANRLEQLGRNPLRYFTQRNYIANDGKEHRQFEMTRLGFDYLVLSFTGARADEYKLQYIDQFHRYANAFRQMEANKQNLEWQQARLDGKFAQKNYCDQGKTFLEYAAEQRGDDRYAKHFYSNLAKAKQKALFSFPAAVKPCRDLVSADQLVRLKMADVVADKALLKGMAAHHGHKVIYQEAVAALGQFADLTGGVDPVVIS